MDRAVTTEPEIKHTTVQVSLPSWPIVTIILAAIVVVIGSILPWATITSGFGSASKNGTSGDGVLTLILAGLAVCVVLAFLARPSRWWVILVFVLFVIVTIIGIHDMSSLPVPSADAAQYVSVDVGTGLWLCVIGAIVGVVAGAWTYITGEWGESDSAERAPNSVTVLPEPPNEQP